MTKNLLVFRIENEIRALDMDAVFDRTIHGFFVFVGCWPQGNEEAQGLLEFIEVSDVFDIEANEFIDVREFELSLNGALGRVLEVQINQNRRHSIAAALLHQIEGAALLCKEIFVE